MDQDVNLWLLRYGLQWLRLLDRLHYRANLQSQDQLLFEFATIDGLLKGGADVGTDLAIRGQ